MGHGLCSRDRAVTSSARPGDPWRGRIMRVVAGAAGLERIVNGLDDLGESGGTRRVVGVAADTGASLTRNRGPSLLRVLCVVGGGTVAAFAGQPSMVRAGLLLSFFRVAIDACLRSRIAQRLCGNRRKRRGAVVAELPERLGHEAGAQQQEHGQPRSGEHGNANDLVGYTQTMTSRPAAPIVPGRSAERNGSNDSGRRGERAGPPDRRSHFADGSATRPRNSTMPLSLSRMKNRKGWSALNSTGFS